MGSGRGSATQALISLLYCCETLRSCIICSEDLVACRAQLNWPLGFVAATAEKSDILSLT